MTGQLAAYRFEWGLEGLEELIPDVRVVVIVDTLRFTTAVSAVIESGGTVIPSRWADEGAAAVAARSDAVLAGRREDGGPSLSPTDLLTLPVGTRLVLPSPNGATLATTAAELGVANVLAGCFRNATATARRARELAAGASIGVVASGERRATGQLRAAVEDLLGAGAVLAALDPAAATRPPCCSPEAAAARAAFVAARPLLVDHLLASESGRQLVGWGWDDDVHASAALDVTDLAAQLVDGEFTAV
ncbi:MAG: 2-phosphosulfolactate phosphatase [Ilumatobacteraceae bacterium]